MLVQVVIPKGASLSTPLFPEAHCKVLLNNIAMVCLHVMGRSDGKIWVHNFFCNLQQQIQV
jgi:hypothetical protein